MDISSLTSKSIAEGKLQEILPEFYDLKNITENNPWHLHQTVFDHVVRVISGMEKVLQLDFFNSENKKRIEKYLNTRRGKATRKEILVVATILHDIAKLHTCIENKETKATRCPGHEILGSFMAGRMGKRFGLEKTSITHLQNIVLHHGFIHEILNLILEKRSAEKFIKLYCDATEHFSLEVVLLAYADMLGSDLPKALPQAFTEREKVIKQILQYILQK